MKDIELSQVWPEWQIEKRIGRGSFGEVYQAVKESNNMTSRAAIKVISIPQDDSELSTLRAEGLDMHATQAYYKEIVDEFINEIKIMDSFKGTQNIVSIEDYKVVEREEFGWDIYIRMELLTPFNTYICDRELSEQEVIALGCDICSALEMCAKCNIIHRDIKPENIFVNQFGDFKLGDFGTARKMESLYAGLSQKGTYNYLAPEVVKGENYDARVDVYALGLVLYRLLNDNRLPFLSARQLISPIERQQAFERRIRGEILPYPCNASKELAEVILKACAYNPEERFADATQMRQELEKVRDGKIISAEKPMDEMTSEEKPFAEECSEEKLTAEKTSEEKSFAEKSAEQKAPTNEKPEKEDKDHTVLIVILIIMIPALICSLVMTGVMSAKLQKLQETNADAGSVIETSVDATENLEESQQTEETQETEEIQKMPENTSEGFTFNNIQVYENSISHADDPSMGRNANGEIVWWCVDIWFDLPEAYSKKRMDISCSWGEVVNVLQFGPGGCNYEAAKNGKTYAEGWSCDAENSETGVPRFGWSIALPDNPDIAGPQTVTISVGKKELTIHFELIYDGDYETGTGWYVENVSY